ncbi:cytochrome c [Acidisoma silvae]|uniref:Cytochrome c n=1 Tax=Acidisoma silvae TaxID=2802396 RepID=A0A963YPW0_9PROT|nr:cytochrome c [Acidisoma silvae]MCB8874100.1 cytochrome c [Acidisoma silvae]
MKLRHLLTGFALALSLPAFAHGANAQTTNGSADAATIAQGQYLARAGDCAACHTAPGGKPFAGGLPIQTPFGKVFTSNITPDADTGIGNWSEQDFARLMRTGVLPSGGAVLPAMPYPSYARVSDADMKALYAYFHQGVQPVAQQNTPSTIPLLGIGRYPLRAWGWIFGPGAGVAETSTTSADIGGSDAPSVARGEYLVEGLGHCGACHTTRGIGMQETALTGTSPNYLAGGGAVDGWVAPSLRGDNATGLGRWREDDIVALLKTGRNQHTAIFGGMNDVVADSMQFMSDNDLHSIAKYLKSLPAQHADAASYTYDDTQSKALFAGDASARGAQIYVDRCAACHRTDGQGYARTFPALAGNPVLQTNDPTSIIHIVLSGSRLPGIATAPSSLVMGPYAKVLNDQEIADVVTFIQTSWGNKGSTVTADQVKAMRNTATPVSP